MNARILSHCLLVLVLAAMLGACASQEHKLSAGEYVDDVVITSKVKAALLKDDEVAGLDVKVETYRGVVQLGDFVDTRADRGRAAELARTIPGVKSVKNDIRLKQDP